MAFSVYPHFKGDPIEKSYEFLDTVLLNAPERANFRFEDIIESSTLPQLEKDILKHISSDFRNLILNDLKYIETLPNNTWETRLSPLGIKVKNSGGHNSYIESLAINSKTETDRQILTDEKLMYDVKNAKRIFKTYWWTFGISIAAFLLTVGKIIFDILKAK